MIPKIIHYCWLSGERKPDSILRCIESWRYYLPDYEIRCWDASCFNNIESRFAIEAFQNRKWAFASDYIRLFALYTEGGVYLDSDVQAWDSIDDLLDNDFFSGLEMRDREHTQIYLEAAVMGASKGNAFIKQCLEAYNHRAFVKDDGTFDLTPIPTIVSSILETNYGWKREDSTQSINGFTVYSTDIIANTNCDRKDTVKLYHLNNRSWIPLSTKEKFIKCLKTIKIDKFLKSIRAK